MSKYVLFTADKEAMLCYLVGGKAFDSKDEAIDYLFDECWNSSYFENQEERKKEIRDDLINDGAYHDDEDSTYLFEIEV